MGVRSSCETLATKSRRTSSKWRSRVTSCSTISTPILPRCESCSAVPWRCTQRSCWPPNRGFRPRPARRWPGPIRRTPAGPACESPRRCSALAAWRGSPPSNAAQVLFRLRIVPSLLMAKTPSSMLDNIASRSFCWRKTVWIRSSSCSAMRFIVSAKAPISSEPASAADGRDRRRRTFGAGLDLLQGPAHAAGNHQANHRVAAPRAPTTGRARCIAVAERGAKRLASVRCGTGERTVRTHGGRRSRRAAGERPRRRRIFLLGGAEALRRPDPPASAAWISGRGRGCPCRAGSRPSRRSLRPREAPP